MSSMRITLTRKGAVPPWYGWASLLWPVLALMGAGMFGWLFDIFDVHEQYGECFGGCSGFALGVNFALQALTDPKQRRVVLIGWSICIVLGVLLFFPAIKT